MCLFFRNPFLRLKRCSGWSKEYKEEMYTAGYTSTKIKDKAWHRGGSYSADRRLLRYDRPKILVHALASAASPARYGDIGGITVAPGLTRGLEKRAWGGHARDRRQFRGAYLRMVRFCGNRVCNDWGIGFYFWGGCYYNNNGQDNQGHHSCLLDLTYADSSFPLWVNSLTQKQCIKQDNTE